jgi:predicted RND superfamily exporter protein
MSETFFKTLIVIAVIILLFYLVFVSIRKTSFFEGLENSSDSKSNSTKKTSLLSSNTDSVSTTAMVLKKNAETLQKNLSISNNKKDYENLIINLEDVYNLNILSEISSATDPLDAKLLESINAMHTAKSALNGVMKFIDSQ